MWNEKIRKSLTEEAAQKKIHQETLSVIVRFFYYSDITPLDCKSLESSTVFSQTSLKE